MMGYMTDRNFWRVWVVLRVRLAKAESGWRMCSWRKVAEEGVR